MGGCFSATDDLPKDDIVTSRYILKHGKTGDIVLWSGSAFDSKLIQSLCNTKWSHIGILIRDTNNNLYLLESNRDLTPKDYYLDPKRGTYKDGVRLSLFTDKLLSYRGELIAYRELILPMDLIFNREWVRKLQEFVNESINCDYTKEATELLGSVLAINSRQYADDYFCTKLVAEAFIRIGFLDSSFKQSNNYQLEEFTSTYQLPWKRAELYFQKEKYVLLK